MESLRDAPKSSSISQPNKERTASGLAQDDDIFDGKFHIKISIYHSLLDENINARQMIASPKIKYGKYTSKIVCFKSFLS